MLRRLSADLKLAFEYARNPPVYILTIFALGMIVAMSIAVTISVQASDRAIRQSIEQDRKQRAEAEKTAAELRESQGREALAAFCFVVDTQRNVYKEAPPSTPAGVKAAKAWEYIAKVFKCKEQ